MARLVFTGPFILRCRSLFKLVRISLATSARHRRGILMAADWDAMMETGILFVRHQFTIAMRHRDIRVGRQIFDSLQTQTDDVYEVSTKPSAGVRGQWVLPANQTSEAVLLYLHGGGYTFRGGVSQRFAEMLAHRTGARVFAPEYRLTPEHAHPAQAEDALAAWDVLTQEVPPDRIVVIGDSAGGHMPLMLLQSLKARGSQQPALCVGLCPWTDIAERGDSLTSNDATDLVQGWMALQFGRWLDPSDAYGRVALSPISHDFRGLAPLYLQAGGREVLRDMIVEFAKVQHRNRADVMLDLWPDMPHDFQAYDSMTRSSTQALARIREAIEARVWGGAPLAPLEGITVEPD